MAPGDMTLCLLLTDAFQPSKVFLNVTGTIWYHTIVLKVNCTLGPDFCS